MKNEYVWERAYEAAILEVDLLKLPKLLQAAKSAIDDHHQSKPVSASGVMQRRWPR